MKTTLHILAILFAVSASATAQVVPEASGGKGLPLTGNLDYSVRYSETADFGSTQGNWETSNVSGVGELCERQAAAAVQSHLWRRI